MWKGYRQDLSTACSTNSSYQCDIDFLNVRSKSAQQHEEILHWWFNGLTFGPRSMMFRNRDEQWRVQTVCLVGRKGRANRGKTHYLFEDLCFGKCVNRECGLKKW